MNDQPPDLNKLAQQIFIFTSLVTKLAGRDREARLAERLPGLSGLQFGVLQILREGPLTLSDIAAKMLLAPATLVPVVQRLEQEQLVVRGRDARDRRRRPLSLSDGGRALLVEMAAYSGEDLITRSLREMGEEQARALDGLLRELLGHLAPEQDVVQQVLASLARQQATPKE